MSDSPPPGFERVLLDPAVNLRGARFTCSKCEVTETLPDRAAALPHLIRRMERLGWEIDLKHAAGNKCPACRRDRKLKKQLLSTAAAVEPPISESEIQMVDVPKPTSEQRFKIRGLLDSHFDDQRGAYLDGYSDERIAQELGLPRKIVETVRDTAYGPIRVTVEFETLKKELAEVLPKVGMLQNEIGELLALIGKLTERSGALMKQHDELEQQVASIDRKLAIAMGEPAVRVA